MGRCVDSIVDIGSPVADGDGVSVIDEKGLFRVERD
jgi:hypothetical protein